jgi:hypothetical protein
MKILKTTILTPILAAIFFIPAGRAAKIDCVTASGYHAKIDLVKKGRAKMYLTDRYGSIKDDNYFSYEIIRRTNSTLLYSDDGVVITKIFIQNFGSTNHLLMQCVNNVINLSLTFRNCQLN